MKEDVINLPRFDKENIYLSMTTLPSEVDPKSIPFPMSLPKQKNSFWMKPKIQNNTH